MLRNKARRGLARVRIGAGRVAGEHGGALRRWLVSRPRPPRRRTWRVPTHLPAWDRPLSGYKRGEDAGGDVFKDGEKCA